MLLQVDKIGFCSWIGFRRRSLRAILGVPVALADFLTQISQHDSRLIGGSATGLSVTDA
jgi:hypothetical protein